VRPERTARNFKAEILNKLDVFAHASKADEFRDAIIFYFSGHGVSEARGRESISTTAVIRDYLLGPASAGLDGEELSTEHALESSEIVTRLQNAEAEKIIIVDACRNLKGGSDTRDPTVYFFDSYRTLRLSSVFLSANLGEKAKIIPYSLWSRKYPDLYNLASVPPGLAGNSLFTHIILQALMCKDGAMGAEVINAQALADFIRLYLSTRSLQMHELRSLLGGLPTPRQRVSDELFGAVGASPVVPWFKRIGQTAPTCISFN
jgi:hypothetical protein